MTSTNQERAPHEPTPAGERMTAVREKHIRWLVSMAPDNTIAGVELPELLRELDAVRVERDEQREGWCAELGAIGEVVGHPKFSSEPLICAVERIVADRDTARAALRASEEREKTAFERGRESVLQEEIFDDAAG